MELTTLTAQSHIPLSKGHNLHRQFDLAAAWFSLTCALHCMLLPMLLAFLPSAMMALRSFQHPWHGTLTWLLRLSRWEWAIALAAASICLISIGWRWRSHRRWWPLLLATAGSTCLLLASLHPGIREMLAAHGLLSSAGGALMASAHLVNRQMVRANG